MSPYRERAIDIYERRRQGQQWKEIVAAFGVTRQRAQQIVMEHEEWLAGHRRARDEADRPPTRALRSSDPERRRMQRWWLERYSLDELLELGRMIGLTD
jgi:hypothetical protein